MENEIKKPAEAEKPPETEKPSTGFEIKKILMALLAVLAAIFVYDSGRIAAQLFWQMLQRRADAAFIAENAVLWSSGGSLLAHLTGGALCLAVWNRLIIWRPETGIRTAQAGNLGRSGRRSRNGWIKTTFFFVLLAVCSSLGLNLLLSLTRITEQSQAFAEVAQAQAAVPVWLGVILYGAAAPFAEEIVFRGIIYGRAKSVLPGFPAVLFSAIVFGLYHGNLVQGIYAFLLGILLAFVYEREKTILAPILLHGIGNLAVFLLLDVWQLGSLVPGTAWAIGICLVLFLAAAASFRFLFGPFGDR